MKYAGKSNTLILSSQIHIVTHGPNAAVIEAERGAITNDPRDIVLEHPRLEREAGSLQADQAMFHLGPDNRGRAGSGHGKRHHLPAQNEIDRAAAKILMFKIPQLNRQSPEMRSRADHAEFLLAEKHNLLRTAILTGNVHVEQTGRNPCRATPAA